MPSFLSFLFSRKFPSRETLKRLLAGPLTGASVVFYGAIVGGVVLLYLLLITINNRFLITVPARGGNMTEGVVGTIHLLNPLLATTETDIGIDQLIYAGLTRLAPDGAVLPDLAERYETSPDGRTYTFHIAPKALWSDKQPLTSTDVAFTIRQMQDGSINPSLAAYWQTISVDTPDDHTVVFMLPGSDVSFPIKASFGILPEHIWKNTTPETITSDIHNTTPIGAGPFTVRTIEKTNGIPRKIILQRNTHYLHETSLLHRLTIVFFANQQALSTAFTSGNIDASYALSPETLSTIPLPTNAKAYKISTGNDIALYRLSNEPMLSNSTLTTTLSAYLDRNAIIDTVEHGYGTTSVESSSLSIADTQARLSSAGYTLSGDTLTKGGSLVGISIATTNAPRLLAVAHAVADQLNALGMVVSVKAFDPGTFRNGVQNGEYSVILAPASATLDLGHYKNAIDLYEENLALVTNNNAGIPIPTLLSGTALHYAQATSWYTNTDRLWKWVTPKR